MGACHWKILLWRSTEAPLIATGAAVHADHVHANQDTELLKSRERLRWSTDTASKHVILGEAKYFLPFCVLIKITSVLSSSRSNLDFIWTFSTPKCSERLEQRREEKARGTKSCGVCEARTMPTFWQKWKRPGQMGRPTLLYSDHTRVVEFALRPTNIDRERAETCTNAQLVFHLSDSHVKCTRYATTQHQSFKWFIGQLFDISWSYISQINFCLDGRFFWSCNDIPNVYSRRPMPLKSPLRLDAQMQIYCKINAEQKVRIDHESEAGVDHSRGLQFHTDVRDYQVRVWNFGCTQHFGICFCILLAFATVSQWKGRWSAVVTPCICLQCKCFHRWSKCFSQYGVVRPAQRLTGSCRSISLLINWLIMGLNTNDFKPCSTRKNLARATMRQMNRVFSRL